MAVRKGSAEWRGDLKDGEGEFALGNGETSAPYTFKSRFEDDRSGSNPEELIGAAQAACYAMQLAAILGEAGTPANSISATANVELSLVDASPTITLNVRVGLQAGGLPSSEQPTVRAAAVRPRPQGKRRRPGGRSRLGDRRLYEGHNSALGGDRIRMVEPALATARKQV
ncbi:MAG: OsmC family peroxiredoxin [Solirubrobacteraceae bacterium]